MIYIFLLHIIKESVWQMSHQETFKVQNSLTQTNAVNCGQIFAQFFSYKKLAFRGGCEFQQKVIFKVKRLNLIELIV